MRKPIIALLAVAGLAMMTGAKASAFCGFYVAKADTKMFNRASKVVIARADNRTVISMANDYEGDPGAFAIVIPTPSILKESQINVAEPALIDHIDAYTAPRLVECFDRNPCKARWMMRKSTSMPMALNDGSVQESAGARAKALGVTVEAEYTIGEYDIQMLSAK